jgi:hypothetical protein
LPRLLLVTLLLLAQMRLHLASQLLLRVRVRWRQVRLLLQPQPDPLLLWPSPALTKHSTQQERAASYLYNGASVPQHD